MPELVASKCCNAPVRAAVITAYSTEYSCSKCGKVTQRITNLRAIFLKQIRKYREYGYRDFADSNPAGTSLPVVYSDGLPHTFLACPTRLDPHYSADAVALINLCTVAYFDALAYHKGGTWKSPPTQQS